MEIYKKEIKPSSQLEEKLRGCRATGVESASAELHVSGPSSQLYSHLYLLLDYFKANLRCDIIPPAKASICSFKSNNLRTLATCDRIRIHSSS